MMGYIEAPPGLENVAVASTAITYIEGGNDQICYRGYDVKELARSSTYEEVAFLLLRGRLPLEHELKDFSDMLRSCRPLSPLHRSFLRSLPSEMEVIDSLAATLLLPAEKTKGHPSVHGPNYDLGCQIIAETPTIFAAAHRLHLGLEPLEPRPDLGHAANFLYMIRGEVPSPVESRAFDAVMILHADNELNTSTFAARVAASTRADMPSAIVAALSTLKGPLHGGASMHVIRQLDEIGEPSRVEEYVKERFDSGQRVTGFGHRVYKVEDPRATVLRELARDLSKAKGDSTRFGMLLRLERAVKEKKSLPVNIDLYSSCVYSQLQIPLELFIPIFAASRTVGWTAHIREEYAAGKLISPVAIYNGNRNLKYVKLSERTSA
jgi:citrate synthase